MAQGPNISDLAFLGRTRQDTSGLSRPVIIAIVISLLWGVGVVVFFGVLPPNGENANAGEDSLRSVMVLMAVFFPLGMIWLAASVARSARLAQQDSARLHAALQELRQAYEAGAVSAAQEPTVERRLNDIARATHKTDAALATFATSRPVSETGSDLGDGEAGVAMPRAEQPSLALGPTADDLAPPVSKPDLVRALNFPDTETDEAGFAALRRALKDRAAKQVIQASQDVLSLLSQDGIYMDDLDPDRARPEIWRRFAKGERGKPVAALGGIRDRSCLALTATRMREDAIFRDAAHHFLRKYDQILVTFEEQASDADLAAFAETRTSRAFMLLGRVTGAFD